MYPIAEGQRLSILVRGLLGVRLVLFRMLCRSVPQCLDLLLYLYYRIRIEAVKPTNSPCNLVHDSITIIHLYVGMRYNLVVCGVENINRARVFSISSIGAALIHHFCGVLDFV